MGTGRLVAAAMAALLPATGYAQTPPQNEYRAYRAETFLRFLDPPGPRGEITTIPHLSLSLGGRPRAAVMDTGSTGIVVSADAIPGIDKLPSQGPATLIYSSSGRIMQGTWVVTPVKIAGADGASITTTPLPVIAVTRIDCTRAARNCTPEDRPTHVAMIGVGFAREADHQEKGTPDKNPFLNLLSARAAPLRRGYVLTGAGAHVGLTRDNTAGNFTILKLERDKVLPDWAAAPACIAIGGGTPACGKVLVDTGVGGMFLTVPPDRLESTSSARRTTLPPGSQVGIDLVPESGVGYRFTVGDTSNPVAPANVVLSGIGVRPSFVNTSFHLLNGFDYLFDADGGWVGYRKK